MTGPVKALRAAMRRPFSVDGCATRSEYWWFATIRQFLLIIAVITDIKALPHMDPSEIGVFSLWSPIFFALTVIPMVAVTIRRLHDAGHSPSWAICMTIPVLGWFVLAIFLIQPSSDDVTTARILLQAQAPVIQPEDVDRHFAAYEQLRQQTVAS